MILPLHIVKHELVLTGISNRALQQFKESRQTDANNIPDAKIKLLDALIEAEEEGIELDKQGRPKTRGPRYFRHENWKMVVQDGVLVSILGNDGGGGGGGRSSKRPRRNRSRRFGNKNRDNKKIYR